MYVRVYSRPVHPSPLHERLAAIVGQRSSRYVGELTATNHETVRRYLAGHTPSVEFLQALCKAFAVSGEWLLTGKGPMKVSDIRQEALRAADPGELLSALATSVETMISRVDRLEQFVQLMEIRVRAMAPVLAASGMPLAEPPQEPHASATPDPHQEFHDGQAGSPVQDTAANHKRASPFAITRRAPPVPQSPAVAPPERVLRLRDALTGRSHPDAARTPPADGA